MRGRETATDRGGEVMATRKKVDPVDIETCASCRFFLMDDPKAEAGYCRRFPPVILSADEGTTVSQPVSMPDDWCGEYKRRTQ
jgi:hypothetical protein